MYHHELLLPVTQLGHLSCSLVRCHQVHSIENDAIPVPHDKLNLTRSRAADVGMEYASSLVG